MSVTSKRIPLSQDAALVAALAGTAMPFSSSAEDQAERWLRALRLHGEVGRALQALGVGEAPLTKRAVEPEMETPPLDGDIVELVLDTAHELAEERSGRSVGTPDLLMAVCRVYDPMMDRALYMRGTSCRELCERLEKAPNRRQLA